MRLDYFWNQVLTLERFLYFLQFLRRLPLISHNFLPRKDKNLLASDSGRGDFRPSGSSFFLTFVASSNRTIFAHFQTKKTFLLNVKYQMTVFSDSNSLSLAMATAKSDLFATVSGIFRTNHESRIKLFTIYSMNWQLVFESWFSLWIYFLIRINLYRLITFRKFLLFYISSFLFDQHSSECIVSLASLNKFNSWLMPHLQYIFCDQNSKCLIQNMFFVIKTQNILYFLIVQYQMTLLYIGVLISERTFNLLSSSAEKQIAILNFSTWAEKL